MYNYLAKVTSLGNCLLMLLIGMFTCKQPNLNYLLQPREISKNNSIIFSIHLKKNNTHTPKFISYSDLSPDFQMQISNFLPS